MATLRQTHEVICVDTEEFNQFVKQLDEYQSDASNAPIEILSSDESTLIITYRAEGQQKTREKLAQEDADRVRAASAVTE